MEEEALVAPCRSFDHETEASTTMQSPVITTTTHELAQTILGTSQVLEHDLSQAMQTYLKMKQELEQLQRENTLTKQALIATQCSQTIVAMRLEGISQSSTDYGLEEDDDDDDDDIQDDLSVEAVSIADPEAGLDEEIRRILPSHSQSLGGGLLGDMEECILEWQSAFELLNEEHERQVQACQEDIQRLHVRLDAMTSLSPQTPLVAEAVEQAQHRLGELVKTVEAFPSKSRLEALQRDLEASRQSEMRALQEYANAVEELEAARRREQDLLERLERAHAGLPLRPKRKTPTLRLKLYTQRKLQRLFKLDQSARKRQAQPVEGETNFAPVSLDISSDGSSSTPEASATQDSVDIFQVGSKEDDPLFVFDNEEDDDWSLHNERGQCSSLLPAVSPTKSTDDTFYSETTEAMTHSTSGTPPPKKNKADAADSMKDDDTYDGSHKGTWWNKTWLWLQ
jgi:hypothetical protein